MEKKCAFTMFLSRGVVVADEETTAEELSQLMDKHNIGAVIILRGEKLVGIVSERDIVRRIVSKGLSAKKVKAKDFMTKDVVVAEYQDGLDKIYHILSTSKFRHLPIVDKGKVVGIASQRDILYGLKPRLLK